MPWATPTIGSWPIAVLGAGVLGRRIACVFVTGGYNVQIRDPLAEARQAAVQYINDNKHEYTKHLPAAKDKTHLFPDCILASNSSSFKSRLMLDRVANPARRRLICNVHFTMPPLTRTVELMTDGETEPGVFPFLTEILEGCGMLPATARRESTGFIFNRLWAAVKREIMITLAEDHMFRSEIGPYRFMDQIGLDTVAFIKDNYIQARGLDGTLAVDWLRKEYLAQGRLGLKSDKGGLYPPRTQPQAPPVQSPQQLQGAQKQQQQQPTLYFLDVGLGGNLSQLDEVARNGKILRHDGRTAEVTTVVSGQPAPDSIDMAGDRMYWTNTGANPAVRDGSVMSSRLDGSDVQTGIPADQVCTPKQLVAVPSRKQLNFCDRHEVLAQRRAAGKADALLQWAPGPSKSGQDRIFRTGLTAENRSGIELVFNGLPEPIDLEIGSEESMLYWTDRGEHPPPAAARLTAPLSGNHCAALPRPIGLKLDLKRRQIFVTDLGGSVYSDDVDSGAKTVLHSDDACYTGIGDQV
ncbi:hypothetical protein B0T24DRAFT_659364 [Lasiosphaeria ovina]|uniref:3-hydroxyacyl-CoA dehydrogenase NAD binding domain-containing protein n=1 Tax=Lasiosphaeria ovina TaxID=92902 RepID=A0AAE0K0F9_9PEZI|nr:hypothetical protein B0T24DRAFT_659364 [Lasiosphaeria ovina]